MGAGELLHLLRGVGLVLTVTPSGGLHVAPSEALTDAHRAAIRTQRDALLLALRAEAKPPPKQPSSPPQRRGNPLITPEQSAECHAGGWSDPEIDTFTARLGRFTDKGLRLDDAERLADTLVIRDREGDDRRLCLECIHLQGYGPWRCGNWKPADVPPYGLARDLVLMLQRCDGFKKAKP